MSMDSSAEIRIESDDDMSDLDKYHQQLRTLILTPAGSVPGNRGFGISFDYIDMPPNQAANFLAMELQEKLPDIIPEIQVDEVKCTEYDNGRALFAIRIREANNA